MKKSVSIAIGLILLIPIMGMALSYFPPIASAQTLTDQERNVLLLQIIALQQKVLELLQQIEHNGGTQPSLVGVRTVCGEVELTWDSVEDASRYVVVRNGVDVAVNLRATRFVDTNLVRGTTYSYEVIPTNRGGRGAPSMTQRVHVSASCPERPREVRASTSEFCGGRTDLSWAPAQNAVRYEIYRGGTLIHRTTATHWSDIDLRVNRRYTYTVRSVNTTGRSAHSETVRASSSGVCPPGESPDVSVERPDLQREGEFSVSKIERNVSSISLGRSGEVLRFRVTAEESDILIERVDVVFDRNPLLYLDTVTARSSHRVTGGTHVATTAVTRDSVHEISRGQYRVRLSGFSFPVPAGESRTMYVFVGILDSTRGPLPQEVTVFLPERALRGSDEVGISYQKPVRSGGVAGGFAHRFRVRE